MLLSYFDHELRTDAVGVLVLVCCERIFLQRSRRLHRLATSFCHLRAYHAFSRRQSGSVRSGHVIIGSNREFWRDCTSGFSTER